VSVALFAISAFVEKGAFWFLLLFVSLAFAVWGLNQP
jgi:hypothetical protein